MINSNSFVGLTIFWCLCSLQTAVNSNCTTLKQIHLVFRHGERNPSMVYPNDPYKSIWSDGLGYLTKKGKLQMYNLGQRMRNKYSCYISDYFIPNDVKVLSSYSDRCLMSAQLFNSGFFVPKNEQIWNPDLLWQPIPITYKPRNEDNMIAAKEKCKKYDESYVELFSTPKYKKILEDNSKLFEYLTEQTGMEIDTIRKVEELYNTLEIEQLQNLTLPKWTEIVFPNSMKPIAALCLASFTETKFMMRMKGAAKEKCKKYDESYVELFSTPKYKKILEDNSKLFEYLTEQTGMEIDTIRKVEELYNTLEIEQLQNLTLPKWTEIVFPNSMKPIAALCLASFTETKFMMRMKGGPFVKKVLQEMKQASTNEKYPKLFIYSGHDITLVNILRTFGFTDVLKPNFGAYFILELHHTPNPEVKLFYSDCAWCEEKELKLKNFENSCELADFENQMKPLIPEDWHKECD